MIAVEMIGYIGNGLLMLCGAPLAVQAFKARKDIGISTPFLAMWYLGEIGALLYVLLKFGYNAPLLMNYLFNIACISVVLYYKFWSKK